MADFAPLAAAAPMAASVADVATRTGEVRDLFLYEIADPVTVKRNRSALVPIVQTGVEGERVAIYNPEIRAGNPLTAFRIRNTTGLTLEAGPITVIEGDSYTGEALLDSLKPDEERITPYSVELACRVRLHHSSTDEEVHQASLSFGYLYLHRHRVKKTVYHLDNAADRVLILYFDHPIERGWELLGETRPVEETENYYRFRIDVPPRQVTEFEVAQKGKVQESHHFTGLTSREVAFYLEHEYMNEESAKLVQELVDRRQEIGAMHEEVGRTETRIEAVIADLERVREHLDALGDTPEEAALREQFVKRLGDGEGEITTLRKTAEALRETISEKEDELEEKVRELRF